MDIKEAIQVANTWLNNPGSGASSENGYLNFYYVVVGHDKEKNMYYADNHALCTNDKESDKIELKQGEYLMKVYHKSSNKRPKVLRTFNG